jgi:hypothetical protein
MYFQMSPVSKSKCDTEEVAATCRLIDSWALVVFSLAGVGANIVYWITYGAALQ